MKRRTSYGLLSAVIALALITLSSPAPALADDLDLDPAFASDPIPDIWDQADSDVRQDAATRSWLWGPVIRSATHEPYAESPDGAREVYYFDKARMEINDPEESWDSIWYATSGLLIREMMLGQIQVGDHESIDTKPAEIPVTGDIKDNDDSPTYATLGQYTSLGDQDENRASDKTGESVTAKLGADGSVDSDFSPPADVEIAYFDETLNHNVPDVFWNWMNSQAIGWRYVVGHPVTEAYWVDTVIEGEPTEVLVQAFERRVLTFNPENDAPWQVEAGNAGLHYREWRDLSVPDDESLHALAYGVPYGEIIAEAATENDVDAYLLAGVAEAASDFDPSAHLSEDRVGLFGVSEQSLEEAGVEQPYDPTPNARVAAEQLATLHGETGDWNATVSEYFAGQDGAAQNALDAWQAFKSDFEGQPSPFDYEPPEEPAPEPEESQPVEPDPVEPEQNQNVETEETEDNAADESGLRYVGEGRAAYYGQGYDVAAMEGILDKHAAWDGGAVEGWDYDPNGYYCVHPDFIPGERLYLTASNGQSAWCTVADYVANGHRAQWRANWAIEMNWKLFEDLGLPGNENHVVVQAPAN